MERLHRIAKTLAAYGRVDLAHEIASISTAMKLAISGEPVARAKERMADALARGGVPAMIKAITTRIKATKDEDKLLGIEAAIEEILRTKDFFLSSLSAPDKAALKNLAASAREKAEEVGADA